MIALKELHSPIRRDRIEQNREGVLIFIRFYTIRECKL